MALLGHAKWTEICSFQSILKYNFQSTSSWALLWKLQGLQVDDKVELVVERRCGYLVGSSGGQRWNKVDEHMKLKEFFEV